MAPWSKLVRRFLVLAQIVVCLLVAAWMVKGYIASHRASETTLDNLEFAVKWVPGNADYHLILGRLYEYVITSVEPEKAIAEFRRAAQLSPYDPQPWLNMAAALELQGKTEDAEVCLRRADFVAPQIPLYQWPIGNFYLLHGNVDEAFHHLRVVLKGTRQYDQIVFSTAWKASGDAQQILNQLIPRELPAEFSYLDYLLDQQQYDDAQPVWKLIMANPDQFDPLMASSYVDSLIVAHRPAEAFQVWTDLEKKGLIHYAASRREGNLVINGDFEDEMLKMGFAWRIAKQEGVYAGLDTSTYHSPGHSFLVVFPGTLNVFYRHVFQYVKVQPDTAYRLQAFMRTDGITTDSGPRLQVRDAYDPHALNDFSDDLTGTSNGWTPLLLDFRTSPKTELVIVSLSRLPSRKFDNLIAGKVWLDDVRVTPRSDLTK
jgi:hypothetical protein